MSERLLTPNFVLYGAPGVGKTTAREYLNWQGFVTVSFAGFHDGGLRHIVGALYGLERAHERPLLNAVGMKLREVDPDVWIRPALREVEAWNASNTPVAMDDMRGENEWDTLTDAGFVRIHLKADESVREARLQANGKLAGSSPDEIPFLYILEDTERFVPDYTVYNNSGDRDELYEQMQDILNLERRKRA
jgi:hypothetical protein